MASGPRAINAVSILLVVLLGGLGYGLWKFFPPYYRGFQVDHALAEYGARSYKLSRLEASVRRNGVDALVGELKREIVDLGVADPDLQVSIDFIEGFAVARCDYYEWVIHPIGGRYTVLTMHRSAKTSLARPRWE